MALHPQAQNLLDMLSASQVRPLEAMGPREAREMMRGMAMLEQQPPPQGMKVEDRRIPSPAGEIPIRVYTPASGGPGLLPGLVYFHGGGWVLGDLRSHDSLCRWITAAARCVVIAVDYRLAPEHKFPAAVDDAYAATAYVSERAAELGVDRDRLAVGGDSAGGNLAAVVSLMARDRGGPPLVCQLLIYPATDHDVQTPSRQDHAHGYLLTEGSMKWFAAHYMRDPADSAHPHLSPLRAQSHAGLPPAIVITAEYDPLRDEGEMYADKLRQAGVPVSLTRYDGMIHGFIQMTGVLDTARQALDELSQILHTALYR